MREEREPRGATVEGWRRVESYIFLETAREKSRPLRGSCPRGHLSRAKESEPKRKRSQQGYEPKEAGRGRKEERKRERKKEKEMETEGENIHVVDGRNECANARQVVPAPRE